MSKLDSSAALDALRDMLASFDETTADRGRRYFEQGRVVNFSVETRSLFGTVRGQHLYEPSLDWFDSHWQSECTCPVEFDCKHCYALGLSWLDACARRSGSSPAPPRGPRRPAKLSFREKWTPLLAEKLGRPLDADEAHALGRLSALFTALKNGWGRLSTFHMQQHGFPISPEAVTGPYGTVFEDWWDPSRPPADPWALWQYIAYDWERSGRDIPDAFRPMTDTTAVRAALEERLLQRELATLRRAFHPAAASADRSAANEIAKIADLRLRLSPEGAFHIEIRPAPDKPWKPPTQRWLDSLAGAHPADFVFLPPAAAALATSLAAACRGYQRPFSPKLRLAENIVQNVLRLPAARAAIVLPDETPFAVEPAPLVPAAVVSGADPRRLQLQLVAPDGRPADAARLIASAPEPLYCFDGRIHRGPPPFPVAQISTAALADPELMQRFRAIGLRLPEKLELRFCRVAMQPRLRCWIESSSCAGATDYFHAQLLADVADPPCAQHWCGHGGWQWLPERAPPARGPDDPLLEFDLATANAAGARFADFKLAWSDHHQSWTRCLTRSFPDEFAAWRATLPPGLAIDATPELAGLVNGPLRAHVDFAIEPAAADARDWFDLRIALRVEDTVLAPDEIALLLKARGKWVRLPRLGWRRLELAENAASPAATVLDRLGLSADDVLSHGAATHRLHALQLAAEADTLADARLAATLRERAAALTTVAPALPASLQASLRPYQLEGFHFLAFLSANGFGGVLADDMGLGKTVQTLAWLLHAAAEKSKVRNTNIQREASPFRALVVCPKSVVHGWLAETARFAPALPAQVFTPALAAAGPPPLGLTVANYTQLRLHAKWFQQLEWDAAILDEGQFIKNPSSQGAATARALAARHRVVLTGTPVENRLLDLWSLFAFAQPGLLGSQAAFRRQYRDDDSAALARLRRRTRHFLLRRTKTQVATDLPPRTEDDLHIELEPAQRKLYDAELKRARQQLLGIESDRALDKVRFNILASLLRLRQICCHPALVDPAHAALPGAKLDALIERLEALRDEGHQVLVFSQFVAMLELIREKLAAAGLAHLVLTGETEDRAALVEKFQSDRAQTVFLLSLRAAGFGLNLTAASYAILYDPWWNPAVEAQAIDRTHRIGQTRPVIAYRLLARDTIEEKIRALQREKAALAAAVVQEESLASVLDLESLRRILA